MTYTYESKLGELLTGKNKFHYKRNFLRIYYADVIRLKNEGNRLSLIFYQILYMKLLKSNLSNILIEIPGMKIDTEKKKFLHDSCLAHYPVTDKIPNDNFFLIP